MEKSKRKYFFSSMIKKWDDMGLLNQDIIKIKIFGIICILFIVGLLLFAFNDIKAQHPDRSETINKTISMDKKDYPMKFEAMIDLFSKPNKSKFHHAWLRHHPKGDTVNHEFSKIKIKRLFVKSKFCIMPKEEKKGYWQEFIVIDPKFWGRLNKVKKQERED